MSESTTDSLTSSAVSSTDSEDDAQQIGLDDVDTEDAAAVSASAAHKHQAHKARQLGTASCSQQQQQQLPASDRNSSQEQDPLRRVDEYFQKHNVIEFFETMACELFVSRTSRPVELMMKLTRDRQRRRLNMQETPSDDCTQLPQLEQHAIQQLLQQQLHLNHQQRCHHHHHHYQQQQQQQQQQHGVIESEEIVDEIEQTEVSPVNFAEN